MKSAVACLGLLLFLVRGLLFPVAAMAAPSAWSEFHGHRVSPLHAAAQGAPGFTLLDPAASGVRFMNRVDDTLVLNNQILENGAGVALGDVDGDGLCDVYLCGSGITNRLYRNLGGWVFQDITAWAGVGCEAQFSTGAAFADIDGDGDLDLLVNGVGTGTRCFLNAGDGRFTENLSCGLSRSGAATSMALADIDGDGDLDLYVTCYRVLSARQDPEAPKVRARVENGRAVVEPADRFKGFLRGDGTIEVVEKGEPDVLYRNDGHGRFSAISWTGGAFLDERGAALAEPPMDWGLSVMLRDLTGDGIVDLYVCNDFFRSPDRFWVGDGRGHFRAVDPLAWRAMPLSSMSVDAGDLDRDGVDDFLVVEMLSRDPSARQRQRANVLKLDPRVPWADPRHQPEVMHNTLHRGRGDGTFEEVAYYAGLAATDWSWSVVLLDVDLDGWEDVLIGTGNGHDVLDMDSQTLLDHPPAGDPRRGLEFYPPLAQARLAFRNLGGLRFRETGVAWGFSAVGICHGMALADLDNDGDLDLVCNNFNAPASVYRNNASAARLAVRLKGGAPNTRGVGAAIRVLGGPVAQQQRVLAGGRYLSADDGQRTFAAGGGTNLTLEVSWPSGRFHRIEGLAPGQLIEVSEAAPTQARSRAEPPVPPLFENVSGALRHLHQDPVEEDFARQPSLPCRLSTAGPGVAWCDVDGDGLTDLVIAAGKGGRSGWYRGDGRGAFAAIRSPLGGMEQGVEQAGLATIAGGVLVAEAAAGSVPVPGRPGLQRVRPAAQGAPPDLVASPVAPVPPGNWGGVAAGDVDGDGVLEVFLGARWIPGRFPESEDSLLVRIPSITPSAGAGEVLQRFPSLGIVEGAVLTDLDGDGLPELALSCDWGPIRIFRREHGQLVAWNPPVRREDGSASALGDLVGRWHGIAAGDFDGDGLMDLALSNEGENNPWAASLPWLLFHGDFAGSGGVEVIEAFTGAGQGRRVPWRGKEVLEAAVPAIRERMPTFAQYSRASVEEILGASFAVAREIRVSMLSSVVLLNRRDHFELRPLPRAAQLAPAFGVVVSDFDGDGNEDLFLAQNFFGYPQDSTRADAGRGLLLRGDGRGGFDPLSGQASGIRLSGEQRGAAVADYDGDGRPDLAVGQHAGATQLLHNIRGKPGLRVRLEPPPGSIGSIGVSLRLRSDGRWGPRREIHAGSGYLSSDSLVPVLAMPAGADLLEVRWPGGRVTTHAVAPGARELTLGP
jgi:hypothetical protein